MKNRLLTTIRNTYFILFCLLFFSCQTNNNTNPPDNAKDIEAIKALLKKVETNWNTFDSTNFYSYLADDIVNMPPRTPANVGKAAVTKANDTFLAATNSHWIIDSYDDVRVSGDLAVARYSYTETQTPKTGGATITIKGKELTVFHRQADGNWKMVTDIWNFNN